MAALDRFHCILDFRKKPKRFKGLFARNLSLVLEIWVWYFAREKRGTSDTTFLCWIWKYFRNWYTEPYMWVFFIFIVFSYYNNRLSISKVDYKMLHELFQTFSPKQHNTQKCKTLVFMAYIHWTEVISSHHTLFAPVQKVKIVLTKFEFCKKVQGFVKILQIMSFQNDW